VLDDVGEIAGVIGVSVVHDECWYSRMILSDLASPAEAGFAKAGNRFPTRIKSRAGIFGIMRPAIKVETGSL
jgi:hypothetical protein